VPIPSLDVAGFESKSGLILIAIKKQVGKTKGKDIQIGYARQNDQRSLTRACRAVSIPRAF
jgi:hypothetical protein